MYMKLENAKLEKNWDIDSWRQQVGKRGKRLTWCLFYPMIEFLVEMRLSQVEFSNLLSSHCFLIPPILSPPPLLAICGGRKSFIPIFLVYQIVIFTSFSVDFLLFCFDLRRGRKSIFQIYVGFQIVISLFFLLESRVLQIDMIGVLGAVCRGQSVFSVRYQHR